jgi:hypothetical protein
MALGASKLMNDNLVVVSSGETIDRSKVCFTLAQNKKHKQLFHAADGTVYAKMPNGCLKRLTTKKNKHQRREEMKRNGNS